MKVTICKDNTIHKREKTDLEVLVTGDFCLDGRVEELCLENKEHTLFGQFNEQLINKDISVANVECPLTIKRSPIVKEGPNLIADPVSIKALKCIDLDLAALSNNHILDQGDEGLFSTIQHLIENDINSVGAGMNIAEAQKPFRKKIKERNISIFNIAEQEFSIATGNSAGAAPIDIIENYNQIIEEKGKADIIILIIHGGNEFNSLPSPDMVKLFRFYASLGVSAIICHHTHCFSGYETYNNVPIFYGLGNFIFDRPNEKRVLWNSGYFLKFVFQKNQISEILLFPYMQFNNSVGLRRLTDSEFREFSDSFSALNNTIADNNKLAEKWTNFLTLKRNKYFTDLLSLNILQRIMIKFNLLNHVVLKKNRLRILINLMRCISHRESTIGVLKNELKMD